MTAPTAPLDDGHTVVIIGGGPAGSSCAIKLKKLSAGKGISPRIILYEGKLFEKKSYYNQCLGVLSPPLIKIMERELATPFPWPIIQRAINGYFIHSEHNSLELSGEHDPSYACRRVEFDNYLFQKAAEAGVEVIPARVTDLDFGPEGVMVFSESNNVQADVVVGAFGLDDGMAKVFERKTAYRQPRFLSSVVTKIHPGEKAMDRFGDRLHAFLPSSLRRVEFGAITPKGNHLSLNAAGKKVDAETMDRFLRLPAVRSVLPETLRTDLMHLSYFKGKFPTLPARGIFGERFIMVGDAAGLNRPFKGKGINSALLTGIRAAEVMVRCGFSRAAFLEYEKCCSELLADIPYGRLLRFLTILFSRWGLLDAVLEAARGEPALKKAFFHIVSGQETYRKTWQETRSWGLAMRLFWKLIIHQSRRKKSGAA